jgi:phage terminase large subunit-like protein
MRQGVPDAVATISVQARVSGESSVIQLASYDQGRTKWQADTVDGVWFDEEPPQDIFSEGITRTNVTLGPMLLTMTPLAGHVRSGAAPAAGQAARHARHVHDD